MPVGVNLWGGRMTRKVRHVVVLDCRWRYRTTKNCSHGCGESPAHKKVKIQRKNIEWCKGPSVFVDFSTRLYFKGRNGSPSSCGGWDQDSTRLVGLLWRCSSFYNSKYTEFHFEWEWACLKIKRQKEDMFLLILFILSFPRSSVPHTSPKTRETPERHFLSSKALTVFPAFEDIIL